MPLACILLITYYMTGLGTIMDRRCLLACVILCYSPVYNGSMETFICVSKVSILQIASLIYDYFNINGAETFVFFSKYIYLKKKCYCK